MLWNRSNTLGLAKASCSHCHGNGIRVVRGGKEVPCQCVFRAVFRTCYNRFRECAAVSHVGAVTLDFRPGSEGRRSYSRKREEFLADFCIISRRTLDEFEQRIFSATISYSEPTGSCAAASCVWTEGCSSISFIAFNRSSAALLPKPNPIPCTPSRIISPGRRTWPPANCNSPMRPSSRADGV